MFFLAVADRSSMLFCVTNSFLVLIRMSTHPIHFWDTLRRDHLLHPVSNQWAFHLHSLALYRMDTVSQVLFNLMGTHHQASIHHSLGHTINRLGLHYRMVRQLQLEISIVECLLHQRRQARLVHLRQGLHRHSYHHRVV